MLYVLLSALPFLTALVLMVGFRFSSARSLVISLVLTCALVLGVWQMTPGATAAYFVYGALKAMELLIIIGGAILLLNTMKQTGMMKVIN
jgi:lactate permease